MLEQMRPASEVEDDDWTAKWTRAEECNDTPDELLAPEAKRLGLLAESCADLLFLGGCDFNVVKGLCPKSCRACFGSDEAHHRDRRQLKAFC